MKPRFHTPNEAADLLGISKRTLRRAVEAGELPCVKYNRRTWRFSAVDLGLWYASRDGRLSTTGTKATKPSTP